MLNHDPHQQQPAHAGTVYAAPGSIDAHDRTRADLARRVLRDALLLGVSASALLHAGPGGIAFPLWVGLLVATLVAQVWHRRDTVSREAGGWMGVALLFAMLHGVDDAGLLSGLDVIATLAALILAGATLIGATIPTILRARVRDLAVAVIGAVRDAVTGVMPLALRDADWSGVGRTLSRSGGGAVIRAVALTLPVIFVFGALLRSADPMFAALVALPPMDAELVASHVFVGGFFAWISAGWLRGIIVEPDAPRAAQPLRLPALGSIEVGAVLGAMSALFAAFVLVQLRWMFGGEAIVLATTGLGYAEYARRGFFELLWVAMLTLPVLLGIDALVPQTDERARRRFHILGRVLLVMLAAVVASAIGRMALYVDYYGLSLDRLYASAFMGWIALLLVWLALTVLRGRSRLFAAGMTISAPLVLLALHAMRPDQLVARYNLARTTQVAASLETRGRERPVDLTYLARLGAAAVPTVVPAVLRAPTATPELARARCVAANALVERWGGDLTRFPDYGDWRRWNPSRDRARELVKGRETQLTAACVGVSLAPRRAAGRVD